MKRLSKHYLKPSLAIFPASITHEFLTRKQVAEFLQIYPRKLAEKDWQEFLLTIRFNDSNLIRYRKNDVMKLLEIVHETGMASHLAQGEGNDTEH